MLNKFMVKCSNSFFFHMEDERLYRHLFIEQTNFIPYIDFSNERIAQDTKQMTFIHCFDLTSRNYERSYSFQWQSATKIWI